MGKNKDNRISETHQRVLKAKTQKFFIKTEKPKPLSKTNKSKSFSKLDKDKQTYKLEKPKRGFKTGKLKRIFPPKLQKINTNADETSVNHNFLCLNVDTKFVISCRENLSELFETKNFKKNILSTKLPG